VAVAATGEISDGTAKPVVLGAGGTTGMTGVTGVTAAAGVELLPPPQETMPPTMAQATRDSV
jgi:hypothetical protein